MSVVVGAVVLLAASALIVPATQSAERTGRGSVNVSAAVRASEEVERQVRNATSVVVGASGSTLTMCTFHRSSSTSRSQVTWAFDATTTTLVVTHAGMSRVHGSDSTFSAVSFAIEPTTDGVLTTGGAVALSVTTSPSFQTSGSARSPMTTLDTAVLPRPTQGGPCP